MHLEASVLEPTGNMTESRSRSSRQPSLSRLEGPTPQDCLLRSPSPISLPPNTFGPHQTHRLPKPAQPDKAAGHFPEEVQATPCHPHSGSHSTKPKGANLVSRPGAWKCMGPSSADSPPNASFLGPDRNRNITQINPVLPRAVHGLPLSGGVGRCSC